MTYPKSRVAAALAMTLASTAQAGSLDSSAPPGDSASGMYTLEALYQRLDTGADGAKRIGAFTEPTAAPAATGYTLDQIMAAMPAEDDANGARAVEVLQGKTFWGLGRGGAWGVQTGSVAAGDNVTGTNGQLAITIPDGLYTGGKTATTQDDSLTAANIKSGATIFGVDGDYPIAAVPKSGQTSCYDMSTNAAEACVPAEHTHQDGNQQKGVGWPDPRFTGNGDGTVTDHLTGLAWLTKANCIGTDHTSFDADGRVTWAQAFTFVSGINDGTYDCGDTSNDGARQSDWRLPTIKELQSLIDFGYYSPSLSNAAGTGKWSADDPFSGVQTNFYWSSTTYAGNTSGAWIVFLSGGGVGPYLKTNSYYMWPVRTGQ